MGRPPSNGGPSFRFNQAEIAEMEAILQAHDTSMPAREVLVSLAEKFSNSEERKGKIEVQMKQVWNWFQNRRYAIRAKAAKSPGKLNITQMTRDDSSTVKGVPQATQPRVASSTTVRSSPQGPQLPTVPPAAVRTFPQAPQHPAAFTVQSAGRVTDNSQMEYEAKSARDGAWYDVSTFLSHRSLETGDPEVLVRFAGFGAEEDEWVNVRKNVRQRSLPCESSECVAVLPADLILCFQEGKEQALYFDAHVLDAQRRRHDVRGCRCRFLVRYDHDQSEEIVALRKICRRPETDYRLQQLHAVNESLSANHNKNGGNNIHTVSTLRVYPPAEVQPPKQHKVEPVVSSSSVEVPQKRQRVDLTVPAPQPDGSQRQFKVEPVVLAPESDAPQHQPTVQHAVPAPSPEVPQYQHKVETVLPDPSAQRSVELQKVESMFPVPSAQDSAESQSIKAITPTHSDEVPLELQKQQPVMPESLTDILVEPHKIEMVMPSSDEAKQDVQTNAVLPMMEASQEHRKAEPAPSGEVSEQAVGPTVAASLEIPVETTHNGKPEEPVVPGSSTESKAEELLVPVFTSDTNVVKEEMETKNEEPVVPVSTSDPNVVEEAMETKNKESVAPVSTSDPNVVEEAMKTNNNKEPVVHVSTSDPNVVEATEEPVVPVSTSDPNLVKEATETKAAVVPVSTSDATMAMETEANAKTQQARHSENMDSSDEGNIAEENAASTNMEEG